MPSLGEAEWRDLIGNYAEVSSFPGVFVLGSFAKYVTIYSQQVRAFNLVYGLHRTGVLQRGTRVAVLGAGAAGITAAAALAHPAVGCEVTLLEAMGSVIGIQRNCTHRWVHPHIYDWPDQEHPGDESLLPIFNWKAEVASKVSEQIENRWKEHRGNTDCFFYARETDLIKDKRGYTLKWTDSKGAQKKAIDALIIAVGFGLEPDAKPSVSYWDGDPIDGSRPTWENQKWLISGMGDGALTDLMRSCIQNFRHADIVDLIETSDGVKGLKRDLSEIHADPNVPDEELSHRFHQLSTGDLEERLRPKVRERGPEVFLTGRTPHLYGRGSSVLNRLIVLLLGRLGAFAFLPGPSGTPKEIDNRYHVPIGYPATIKVFDRVILRHGTEAAIGRCAKQLLGANACKELEEAWTKLKPHYDLSRRPLWAPGFFGEERVSQETSPALKGRDEVAASAARTVAFDAAAQYFGVKIAHLAFYKDLQSDGCSTVTYVVQGLTTAKEPIQGVHFTYKSVAGKVGSPVLDSVEAERYGLSWVPDDKGFNAETASMDELREAVRRISGTISFKKPLASTDPPMSFTLRISILNGDASSRWEYDQLYEEKQKVHVDTKKLKVPTEYFARFVWCPVEVLKMQVKFPSKLEAAPRASAFSLPRGSDIEATEVLRDSIVQLYPPAGSAWDPENGEWERQSPGSTLKLENPTGFTYELTVDKPAVGSCYTIDWSLADWKPDDETAQTAEDARKLRSALVEYSGARAKKRPYPRKKDIRRLFIKLRDNIAALQANASCSEPFRVAFMTYDDAARRLRYVDGASKGEAVHADLTEFWLPFGLGLSGACLKRGDRAFAYFSDQVNESASGPEFFLKIPGSAALEGMVAMPVVHPRYYASPNVEPGRMCIGVVDVSFASEPNWLKLLRSKDDAELTALHTVCQNFCDQLCRCLGR